MAIAAEVLPAKHGNVHEARTVKETAHLMWSKLAGIVPDVEIAMKAELACKVNRLKCEKNAVILGHNYMEPALYHSVPDYVGDSLELSRISTQTYADIIVFCGVQFMAETAKILNPGKVVLVPAEKAGCSLAEGITAADVHKLRASHPGDPVISYVNTYAEVKAVSDYCCTSGNASAVVRHLLENGHREILFLPDEYLARNTAAELGLGFVLVSPESDAALDEAGCAPGRPRIIGWKARCEVHELYKVDDVLNARKQFPGVVVLAHPECHPDVVAHCDYAGSTKGMIDYVKNIDAPRYLLLTECSMGDNIAAEFPHREMVRACSLRCKYMNTITLESTLAALENTQYEIELSDDLIENARQPIDRMLAIR